MYAIYYEINRYFKINDNDFNKICRTPNCVKSEQNKCQDYKT